MPTVSDAVRRAAAICDPEGSDAAVSALVRGFEDDDRPATASEDLAGELFGSAAAIDPDGDSAAARMTAAGAAWLATNPDQADEGDHVLREAARLCFGDETPAPVRAWLAGRGIEP